MKRFVIYVSSLLLPLFLLMITIEILVVKIPNSYSYKYRYIKTHGDSIKILAIGHSHIYDGFDPNVFGNIAFNLGNSSQDFIDDYYLLRELIDNMPNLKVVIMPIGYSDVCLSGSNNVISERGTYYYKYMNIDYDGKIPLKYRFESLNIPKACKKLYEYYIMHEDIVGCDSLGRRNKNNLKERKWKLEDSNIISKFYTLKETSGFVLRGEMYVDKIVEMLKKRDIVLVMVSTPFYYKSLMAINLNQQSFVKDYMSLFTREKEILYWDYQASGAFVEKDFYDDAHLSEYGALKFTKMLKDRIQSCIKIQ